MPLRWNAWTHLQAVQFDHERQPRMRQVRLCGGSLATGDVVRIGVSGVEIEAVVVFNAPGLLTVRVKPTQAKAKAARSERKRKRRA